MNLKRKHLLIILMMASFFSCKKTENSTPVQSVQLKAFLRAEGPNIVDGNGNIVLLKGTNIGNWLVPEGYMFKMDQVNAPRKIDELLYELVGPDSLQVFWKGYLNNYITQKDIKFLKRIGCNHIRLPFHYKLFTDELYMGEKNAGFTYFDRIIEWCKQEDLYVLLDMHCAPGGQTGDNIDDSYGYPYLLKSQSSQDLMTEIWVKIAQKYADEPIVLGYDLVNEPIAHHFENELDTLNHSLFELYNRITREVRKVDQNHMIFLNGSVWSTNFDVFESIIDENIVYEFHKYWFDVNQEAIQAYIDFSQKNKVPVYIGETGENSDEWVNDFRTLLDQNKIGWCFWPYKKMNNLSGIMNFTEPKDYHLISAYAKSNRSSFAEIRKNKPESDKVQLALNEFLENCKYENCFFNAGYIEALNFKVGPFEK